MIKYALVLFALLPAGCTKGVLDQAQFIPFEPLLNYQLFAVPDAGTRVIRSEAEWLEFCNNFWSEGIRAPIPYIDFDQKILLGLFWGGGIANIPGVQMPVLPSNLSCDRPVRSL